MLDFWLPMLLRFVAATITVIAMRRKRDRYLNYFNREPVMVPMQSGKWLWGRFVAYPKAMELVFEAPKVDGSGSAKASYVPYSPEVGGIKKILQAPPLAGSKEHGKWQQEIERIANPSPLRRFRRWVWNEFNTLRNADEPGRFDIVFPRNQAIVEPCPK